MNEGSRQAIFVDLPNFYSRLLKSAIDEPRALRDWFLEWFDFDRLSSRLTGQVSPVWVFYSGQRIGPSDNRIDGKYLEELASRLNATPGVTAYDVNIPGLQREPATHRCENCGHEGLVEFESEKGIDSSLTVRMLDTADSWDVAYLLSGDADFVPAVAALRRRGKIVVGAGFSQPSPALVRECYDYIDLTDTFAREDNFAFRLFGPDGAVKHWLSRPIIPDGTPPGWTIALEVVVDYASLREWTDGDENLSISEVGAGGPQYNVYFRLNGPAALAPPTDGLRRLGEVYPRHVLAVGESQDRANARLSPLAWTGVERRLSQLRAYLGDPEFKRGGNTRFKWSMKYVVD